MAERLFRLLNIVDSWLFPEKITCLCCDPALGDDEQDGLCPGCTQALAKLGGVFQTAPPPAGIHSAFAAFPYADQPRKLILMLKFDKQFARRRSPWHRPCPPFRWAKATRSFPCRPPTAVLCGSGVSTRPGCWVQHLGEIWGMPVLPAPSRKDEHTAQMKLRRRKPSQQSGRLHALRRLRQRKTHPACGRRADHRFHRVGSRAGAAGCGACRVSLVTAAKTIAESGDPLFVPARGYLPLSCRTTRRDFSSHPRQKQAVLNVRLCLNFRFVKKVRKIACFFLAFSLIMLDG